MLGSMLDSRVPLIDGSHPCRSSLETVLKPQLFWQSETAPRRDMEPEAEYLANPILIKVRTKAVYFHERQLLSCNHDW